VFVFSTSVQIKGTALRSIFVGIERVGGKSALANVKAAIPPDVLEQMERVVPSGWYPIELSAALHHAIRKTSGQGTMQANFRIGIEAAKVDYSGVYRAVLWTMDPEAALRRLERSWRQYNSQGEAHWERLERGFGVCRIEGARGYHTAMWVAITGRIHGLLELCGAASVSVELGRNDATSCIFEARWTR
jgi:hypothetical protein